MSIKRLGARLMRAHTRMVVVAAVLVATAIGVGGASATGGNAGTTPNVLTTFTQSKFVSFTLEGCRNDGSITFGLDGPFVCPDADYTTGNLGKGWNELDLVPHRLTTSAGNQATATTDYSVYIAADYETSGRLGYDVISVPEVNTDLSDASCSVSAGDQSTEGSATDPFGGGTDTVVYRELTIHQDQGTTCVFDYYERLALGAHEYPGSSLQSYMFDQEGLTGSKKTVSIPVNQIEPQSIDKDMSATQDADTPWNLTKAPTPATVNFGDICSTGYSDTQSLSVKVEWTKLDAVPSGEILLVANIYATNPSSRTITTTVTDRMYEGTTQSVQVGTTWTSDAVDVPANTTMKIGTDTQTVSSTATHFNDVATATYTDLATGVPVPGTTTATAGADVETGTVTNTSADIVDSESITGTGLSFKVSTPTVGSFVAPSEADSETAYTAGTYTVGPVTWDSGTQSDSGSVTFSKTLKLDPAQITTGTISDEAVLTGSDGLEKTADLDVNISSSAVETLTITKTIPMALDSDQTFGFKVYDSEDELVASPEITIPAGDTSKSIDVEDLLSGSYTVEEASAPTGYDSQADQDIDLIGSTCTGTVTFDNTFDKATAAATKVTDPTTDTTVDPTVPYAEGWTLTLTKPDATTVPLTTDSSGAVSFGDLEQEGDYTITETTQTGWTAMSAAGGGTGTVTGDTTSCSFSVDYPADAGKTFTCTFTNKSRGNVEVHKTVNGLALSGGQSFTFQIRDGASTSSAGTVVETETATAANGGVALFTSDLLPGHTYAMCEFLIASYGPTFPDGYGPYNPNSDPGYLCFDFSFQPADTVDPIVFGVDNTRQENALTIGYWKTHAPASCKQGNGKQADDLTGALGSGFYLGPYDLTVPCKAVYLLSKENINGQKRPGDPIYNMVAQLVGAKLNVNNGAGQCTALTDAFDQAQTLLNEIDFDGKSSYKDSLSPEQATMANDLAATFDAYNNNNLC